MFNVKLYSAIAKADRVLIDGQELLNIDTSSQKINYGDDWEFPESLDAADQTITVGEDADGQAKFRDDDGEEHVIEFLMHRPMTAEDLVK